LSSGHAVTLSDTSLQVLARRIVRNEPVPRSIEV
jgi:hypothetical protein